MSQNWGVQSHDLGPETWICSVVFHGDESNGRIRKKITKHIQDYHSSEVSEYLVAGFKKPL